MKLEEIEKEWLMDSEMGITKLDIHALNTPSLHAKWLRILMAERKLLRKLEAHQIRFSLALEKMFLKTATKEELDEFGLMYENIRVLKQDINKNISAHKQMITLNQNICVQTDKIGYIESIIKMITNRGFLIKSAVDYQKFQAGL